MSKRTILEDDWSDYDDRKKKKGDANFFACTESWEVDYLVRKIRKQHPEISELRIREAISSCCRTIPGNKPRKEFVECVAGKLNIF
ncbi:MULTISPECIES: hypothetical protein [Chryseobacterium]|uniref:Uncharacterized protein n=1 Tax=Candidatus Chryseobacterium massiliense TaxID=204089 RepID=A0A3D9B9X7_9FLAO|nr:MULTISPECIES: hypothetical protein [Chryseobacterium]REC49942.1 hypothetical protein DRF68_09915 [Candidatus Chryseobacterium massiliae]